MTVKGDKRNADPRLYCRLRDRDERVVQTKSGTTTSCGSEIDKYVRAMRVLLWCVCACARALTSPFLNGILSTVRTCGSYAFVCSMFHHKNVDDLCAYF